jgi:hypothetical protein
MSDEEKKDKKDKPTDTFSGEMKPEKKKGAVQMVTVTFMENRKFDLHIGRSIMTFMGRETKQIPAEWLNHRDWQNIKHYFGIKGV